MDLKDITRGLRGGDERTRADDESGKSTDEAGDDGDPAEATGDDRTPSGSGRDDDHVCPFCETEFDADRGACPECDAEIVLRGTR